MAEKYVYVRVPSAGGGFTSVKVPSYMATIDGGGMYQINQDYYPEIYNLARSQQPQAFRDAGDNPLNWIMAGPALGGMRLLKTLASSQPKSTEIVSQNKTLSEVPSSNRQQITTANDLWGQIFPATQQNTESVARAMAMPYTMQSQMESLFAPVTSVMSRRSKRARRSNQGQPSANPPTPSTPPAGNPPASPPAGTQPAPPATQPTPQPPTANPPSQPAPAQPAPTPGTTASPKPSLRQRFGNWIAGNKNGQTATGGTPPNNQDNQNKPFLARLIWETKNNNFGQNYWKWRNVGRVGLYSSYPARKEVWPFIGGSIKYMAVGPDSIPAAPRDTTTVESVVTPVDSSYIAPTSNSIQTVDLNDYYSR